MYKVVNPEVAEYEPLIPASNDQSTVGNDTNVSLNDMRSIELVTGSAVIDLLLKPAFQESVDLLFESTTWATVFQSRRYITAWYQVYHHKHLPVLVIAVEKGKLTGLLPMVILDTKANDRINKRNRITGAGHYDAEYQSWLAIPSYGESFIKDALGALMKQFPGHPVTFRYLPPATPLGWLKSDKWRQYATLQSYTRPLIDLNQPDHAKLLKSRQFRNKLNRLKRLGEVQLESITDIEHFKTTLDELAVLYDFRFSALFNKPHFKNDPSKKELLLELFRLQLLHVTLLKVNGKTFAGVVGVAGKDWVYLSGFSCHTPFKARIYSPGLLHFSLLAKKLKEENSQYFDLTPGYDSYKDKLANHHDEVHELMISSDLIYQKKKRIRKWLHVRLIASGIRPMTAELALKKYFYRLKNTSITAVIKKMAKRVQGQEPMRRYAITENALLTGGKIISNKDNLNDLLQFKTDKGAGITRWKFLADAMFRLETGQHCYTWVENGRLLSCAWFTFPDAEENSDPLDKDLELTNLYSHTAGKDQLQFFLYNVIDAVITETKAGNFISNEKLFCQVLDAIGFERVKL